MAVDSSVLESMKANLITSSAGLNGGFSAVRGHCKTLNNRARSSAFMQPRSICDISFTTLNLIYWCC